MENKSIYINVEDQQSLIHLGSLDSFDITAGGKKAAKLILSYLKKNDKSKLERAIKVYESIIPNENFGGEYTALEWLCKFFLAPSKAKEDLLSIPINKSFYNLLCDNNYENLITYLKYKYHIVEYGPGDNIEIKAQMRFLEDFILFNNPDRERWETTRENIEKLNLKPGSSIADVGCGPGYYSFKFADIVGEEGKVYAIETNPKHLDFLRGYVKDNDVNNVEIVESSFEGIGLSPYIRVDAVYICSLYHNVYAAFTDAERNQFVNSIRTALNDGGQLIIVDNDLVAGQDLPYHGPYVNKDMLISQLYYYGFELKDKFQFSPQRYVLIFDKVDIPLAKTPDEKEGSILVKSTSSLVRYRIIGTSTSGYTMRGKRIGRVMYEGFTENNEAKLKEAYEGFSGLWPQERIGDDYTAFMWFIEYKLADEEKRKVMTKDLLTKYYADYFCSNDFERFKTYVFYKFHLELPDIDDASDDTNYEYNGKDFSIGTLNQWNEFLVFDNPNRNLWEQTEKMCEFFNVKKGEYIADIGCGGGFFTWYFSKAVGETGCVYATEINKDALYYLEDFINKNSVSNIKPIITKMNDAGLPKNSVDTIFMCSMYHAVYITDIEFVKDSFISTIHKALRKGGRLIIVDNNVTEEGVTPYYGPGIHPDLIVKQLKFYGFDLKERFELIPQRYALVFEKNPDYNEKEMGGKDKNGRENTGGIWRKQLLRTKKDAMPHEG